MKRINYLALNGRKMRTNGNIYRFLAFQFGKKPVLCSAECISGPDRGLVIHDFIRDRRSVTNCLKVGINHNLFV